jgi:RND superfamily putative drug exporter
VTTAKHVSGVASVSDPYTTKAISKNATIARINVQFDQSSNNITAATRAGLATAFAAARHAGLQVQRGGDAVPGTQSGGATEGIGILIAVLVLAITFGSMLAAGLPLLTAFIGVMLGLLGITGATALVDLNSSVTSLALMLGLAVGIDYALFIISRHRSQVAHGLDLRASAGRAVATAGSAVVFAGVIALAALFVCGVPFLTAMGFAGAATVAIAVLIALTLVPALLGFAGARATKGKMIDANSTEHPTLGRRWVNGVIRYRVPAVLACTLGLLAIATPALHMRLGLPGDGSKPTSTTERRAYDLLAKGFGVGYNGQLTVVAKLPSKDAKAAARTVETKLKTLNDVTAVSSPTLATANTLAIYTVTPRSAPQSAATENLVRAVRDQQSTSQASLLVTGTTAVNIDVAQRMSDSLLPYLLVVIGLALVLLTIAFRSILVPVTAVAGFPSSRPSAPSSPSSKTASPPTSSASPDRRRSSASYPSSPSESSSDSRWTTRSSSSPA